MKYIYIFTLLITTLVTFSQDEKTVTLVTSGTGTTMEQATQNALRSAIEQAFGAFISSNTKILNDQIVKDEIVSISNGNIRKYDLISKIQISDHKYAITVKAIVSVSKLTSFCESKGVVTEFKGSLFSFNINQQKINEANELEAITNIIEVTEMILDEAFFGSINAGEPFLQEGELYNIPLEIKLSANENVNVALEYFVTNIRALAMSQNEILNYQKLKKTVFELIIVSADKKINGIIKYETKVSYQGEKYRKYKIDYKPKDYNFELIFLRNLKSIDLVHRLESYILTEIADFKIISNANEELILESSHIVGSIPLSSPNANYRNSRGQRRKILSPFSYYSNYAGGLDIIIPSPNSCCGASWNDEAFPTFNKSLAKYFCKRRYSKRIFGPFYIIILHKYNPKGIVLNIDGYSILTIDKLKNISSINVNYN